jgi:hypothetical protein
LAGRRFRLRVGSCDSANRVTPLDMSAKQDPVQLDIEDAIADALRRCANSEDIPPVQEIVPAQNLPVVRKLTFALTRAPSQTLLPLPHRARRLDTRQTR